MPRTAARPAVLRGTRVAAIVTCLAALAACSGPSGATTSGTDGETPQSPLEKIFADAFGEWDEAEMVAEQMKSEEMIAACMAEQGFEYTPVDYGAGGYTQVDDTDTSTREWAEKNGYAMTIMPEEWNADPGGEEIVDPNQEYVESMSEAEQTAYYEALYGDFDYEANPDTMPDPSEQGCSGKAQEELYGNQNEVFESEEMTAFSDAMEKLQNDIDTAPELSELNTKWSACMADAGFGGYENPQAAQDDFMERSNAFWESMSAEGEVEEDFVMPEMDPEIQDAERATAVADFDCQKEVDYQKAHQKVQFAKEQEFVDSHQAEIDAYLAVLEKLGL